jgi:hypothetical protein
VFVANRSSPAVIDRSAPGSFYMRLFACGLAGGCGGARCLVFLFCLMVADCAARSRAGYGMIPGDMAGDTAYRGAFRAAFGLRNGVGQGECRSEG